MLPALPATVAAFLSEQTGAGEKASTLARYTASIARLHALADQPDPTRAELVRLELKAQRRALGVRQRQARGLRFRGEVADPLATYQARRGGRRPAVRAAVQGGSGGRRRLRPSLRAHDGRARGVARSLR